MAENKEIKLVISADNSEAVKKLKEFASSLTGVKVESEKLTKGQNNLATAVFKGTAAWDILKKGISTATTFLVDSVKASVEAEAKMDLVRRTVESYGGSLATVMPQVETFAQKMAQLGRDDEDVALATVKFAKALSGDTVQAMKMVKLASDLTSSGYGTMEENVDNLSKVLSGKGSKALLAYKLNLDANATTQEQVDAITKKVTRTTEQWAQTTEGQLTILKTQWGNFKEEIGLAFGPALTNALTNFNRFLGVTSDNSITWGQKIGSYFNKVVGGLFATAELLGGAYDIAKRNFLTVFSDAGIKGASEGIKEANADIEKHKKALVDIANTTNNLDKTLKLSQQTFTNSSLSVGNLTNRNKDLDKSASDTAKKVAEKMVDLGGSYKKMSQEASQSLIDLKDEHEKNLSDIRSEISKTQQDISDLQSAYNKQQTDDVKTVAEQVVATEQKIADIKEQLTTETDAKKRAELNNTLSKEQQALVANAAFITSIDGAVQEARKVAMMSELERTIYEYNQKRALADQEYQEKLARLNTELEALRNKEKEEITLYATKVSYIDELNRQAALSYAEITKQNLSITETAINAEIDMYNQLAKAIASVRGGSAKTVGRISAAASAGEQINNVVVNVTGNNINNTLDLKAVAEKVGQSIMGTLRSNKALAF